MISPRPTEGVRLALVYGEAPTNRYLGPVVIVRRYTSANGRTGALLRIGAPDAAITDPADLRALADAFAQLAREAESGESA